MDQRFMAMPFVLQLNKSPMLHEVNVFQFNNRMPFVATIH